MDHPQCTLYSASQHLSAVFIHSRHTAQHQGSIPSTYAYTAAPLPIPTETHHALRLAHAPIPPAVWQAIARGVTKAGVGVETLNLELVGSEEVAAELKKADGFILGSPTLGGHMPTQVSVALGTILTEQHARALPCGVFGSFGCGWDAVRCV